MSDNFDSMIKTALADKKDPKPDLNRQILVKVKENEQMKRNKIKKAVAAAACIGLAAVSSVSAYAAYRYLSPSQVAEKVSNNALAQAFKSGDAIEINQTQSTNGYDITLLGLVSGESLEMYISKENTTSINNANTYAVVAIERTDGSKMENRSFCISPLINGVDFSVANNSTLDTSLTFFEQDGILYHLMECDSLEMFANQGVQLGVVDSFGNENKAFQMDEETGIYSKKEDYEKTNALFTLPLDKANADDEAVKAYIEELMVKVESVEEVEIDENLIMLAEFVDTITPQNIDDYFVRDDRTEFIAVPDENGWIEFGYKYIEEEDYLMEGASGYTKYMINDEDDFAITGYGYGSEDFSDLQIETIWRNEDGSFTTVIYRAKVDLSFVLE